MWISICPGFAVEKVTVTVQPIGWRIAVGLNAQWKERNHIRRDRPQVDVHC